MSTVSADVSDLISACKMFSQDLAALPESAFMHVFGDKVRTVADIVYEVILVNDHIGMVIRDEKPFDWPEGGWITAPTDFNSKHTILAAFEESCAKILDTATNMTPEELTAPLTIESGETNRGERCRFMALHLWYHSGQLNFIQTLLGDDEWHWN